jgi:hypothetical protein
LGVVSAIIVQNKIGINMKLLILLGAFFLFSCNNRKTHKNIADNKVRIINSTTDSFDIFLDKFVLKKLPISIDERLLNNFSYNDDLDTLLVSQFIEKDSVIAGDLSIYSSTKYYPLYKFEVGNLWAIIVMYSSGAGAVDDEYHLIVYDNSGLAQSNLTVGKQLGDCDGLETQTFLITPSYLISSKDKYYSGNCGTDKMKLSKNQILKYQIERGGNIKQLNK